MSVSIAKNSLPSAVYTPDYSYLRHRRGLNIDSAIKSRGRYVKDSIRGKTVARTYVYSKLARSGGRLSGGRLYAGRCKK